MGFFSDVVVAVDGTTTVSLSGQITITNLDYSPLLADPTSTLYKNFEARVCDEVGSVIIIS